MEKEKLEEEIHELYFHLVPLFHKSKTFYVDKNRTGYLCNKNQGMAIMIIGKAGEITPTTLSKFIQMEKGSLTTLVDSLEKMGFVARSDDPNDRRKVILSLTTNGIEYMKTLEKQSREGLSFMLGNLNEKEIYQMHECLKILVVIFRKIANSAA